MRQVFNRRMFQWILRRHNYTPLPTLLKDWGVDDKAYASIE
jgi:hypothetical protein